MMVPGPIKSYHRRMIYKPPHDGFTWKEWLGILLVLATGAVAFLWLVSIVQS